MVSATKCDCFSNAVSSTVNVCPVCCVRVMDGPEGAAERFTRMVFPTEFFVGKKIFVLGDFKCCRGRQ